MARCAIGALLLLLLAGGFVAFGWRYGFTPLPMPAAGIDVPAFPMVKWSELTPTNRWFHMKDLADLVGHGRLGDLGEILTSAVSRWKWYGIDSLTNTASLEKWLGIDSLTNTASLEELFREFPEIDRCLSIIVAMPPRELLMQPLDPERNNSQMRFDLAASTERYLQQAASWRAAQCERARDVTQGIEWCKAVFRLHASHGVSDGLAKPFRRIAAFAPSDIEQTRRWLDELAALTNDLPALEELYVAEAYGRQFEYVNRVRIDADCWPTVWSTFREAFEIEWKRCVELLLTSLGFGERSVPQRQWADAFNWLWFTASASCSREADIEAFYRAVRSHAIKMIRAGKVNQLDDLTSQWRSKKSFLPSVDRPIVWRAPIPHARVSDRWRKKWLMELESVRLVLALHAYHGLHKRWPARLEEMVPEVLDSVPCDPFSGKPFGYDRTDQTNWVCWANDSSDIKLPRKVPDHLKRFGLVFTSTETQDDAAAWRKLRESIRADAARATNALQFMDPRMIKRYFPHLDDKVSTNLPPANP